MRGYGCFLRAAPVLTLVLRVEMVRLGLAVTTRRVLLTGDTVGDLAVVVVLRRRTVVLVVAARGGMMDSWIVLQNKKINESLVWGSFVPPANNVVRYHSNVKSTTCMPREKVHMLSVRYVSFLALRALHRATVR